MRYLLTGDEITAAAYRLGLVQEVTESGQQFDRALEVPPAYQTSSSGSTSSLTLSANCPVEGTRRL